MYEDSLCIRTRSDTILIEEECKIKATCGAHILSHLNGEEVGEVFFQVVGDTLGMLVEASRTAKLNQGIVRCRR
jgi:hypothetical protein